MSKLLSRIMLAIFLVPCAAILYTILIVTLHEFPGFSRSYRDWVPWFWAGAIAWAFIAIYWILLWHRAVNWTALRRRRTIFASAVAAIVGGILGLLTANIVEREFGFFVLSSVTPLVWLPLTALIWRETPAERTARLAGLGSELTCPTCGYNLKGLKTTQCPECGSSFTLDELLEHQPGREFSELQR